MNNASDQDRKLLARCFSGADEALETLVRKFSSTVYRSVQYTLMSKHISFSKFDLEDLHNTVFLRLLDRNCKKLRQFRGDNGCSLHSWVRMIAVRTVLDQLRKKGVDAMTWRKNCSTLDRIPELKAHDVGYIEKTEENQKNRLIQKALTQLTDRDRLCLKLHFVHGLSPAEASEIMNTSVENTYNIKHRAVQRLKAQVVILQKREAWSDSVKDDR
jgi:RNA polymerase sigma factor (sigma-70 family)